MTYPAYNVHTATGALATLAANMPIALPGGDLIFATVHNRHATPASLAKVVSLSSPNCTWVKLFQKTSGAAGNGFDNDDVYQNMCVSLFVAIVPTTVGSGETLTITGNGVAQDWILIVDGRTGCQAYGATAFAYDKTPHVTITVPLSAPVAAHCVVGIGYPSTDCTVGAPWAERQTVQNTNSRVETYAATASTTQIVFTWNSGFPINLFMVELTAPPLLPSAAGASSSGNPPTLSNAPLLLAPSVAGAAASGNAPSLANAPLLLSPAAAGAVSAGQAPAITNVPLIVVPGVGAASGHALDPVLANAPLLLSPGAAGATSAGLDGELVGLQPPPPMTGVYSCTLAPYRVVSGRMEPR